mgnify:FL=1
MDVVIDSNVLFRTLISKGDVLDIIFNEKIRLFAPLKLKEEFLKHKKEVLLKSKLSEKEFNILCSLILNKITFVQLDEYKNSIPKAKELLGEHIKDLDFVALCLSKGILFWTYEDLLFKIGIGISTKQVSLKLTKEFQ